MQPFGFAVVPDVYMIIAVSFTRTRAFRRIDVVAEPEELGARHESLLLLCSEMDELVERRRLVHNKPPVAAPAQRRERLAKQRRIVDRVTAHIRRDQHTHVGVPQHMTELAGLEPGVDGNRQRAELRGAVHARLVVDAVRHEDRNGLARPDAE
jgi:hypothetical protein